MPTTKNVPAMISDIYKQDLYWGGHCFVETRQNGWLKPGRMVGWNQAEWLAETRQNGWLKTGRMVGWNQAEWLAESRQNGWLKTGRMVGWNQAEWLAENKASEQNFEIIGNTAETLVHTECEIQNELALGQLDKIPLQEPRYGEFSSKHIKEIMRWTKPGAATTVPEMGHGVLTGRSLERYCFIYPQDLYSGDFQRAKSYHLWTR
jgi:hypothetical protein